MPCVADACRQGRLPCDRLECCEPVEPLCSAIEELRTIRRTALLALVAGLGTLAVIWFAIANLP